MGFLVQTLKMCESQTTGLFMFVANWSDEGRNTFVMKDEMSSSQTSPEPSSGWLCKSGFCLRKTGGFWCGEPGFRVFHVLVSGRDHSMRLVRITCQWWSPVNNVVNHIRERESLISVTLFLKSRFFPSLQYRHFSQFIRCFTGKKL